ncbi:type I restriction-modification enzyme R subunit C-terminal domain-containing protein [Methanolobus bombayensis]|uniref:type I restriction endonuclease subunit R n=1 Tax=Methanolobus bombayensis TaxID=38023 RepID=UPI001AE6644E|nr:type I restriction-modification enzyme R subunit C-terminal domain-containing protein [Methanolobus bombayensis]MBP1908445.1 type I restriction enzyme R subunit [Methanolobus bombayensis]
MQDLTEKQTRKKLIDPLLAAEGWKVVLYGDKKELSEYNKCAIGEYPTSNGPADYALCVDGKILGIIEAKKLTLGPQSVLTQAERYSKGVSDSEFNFDSFKVPFLYSTNGTEIWHHDVRDPLNRSRKISSFHTPEALVEMINFDVDTATTNFFSIPDNQKMRPYQCEACDSIGEAIDSKKRTMMLAMATGTGKTFTVVNLIYRLMKAGVAKRVLFLVDRRALAAQAVRAFSSFETEQGLKFDKTYEVYSQRFQRGDLGEDENFDVNAMPESYLTDPKTEHSFVYVSTIQRMTINLFGKTSVFSCCDESEDEDVSQLDIPIHAFDLIIADECHRGYSAQEISTWRKTLDHFDAIKIGLTATPAAHTSAYFKDIVFKYSYEQAVREGYLVDYDIVALESGVRMNGIFLHEGEAVEVIDPETGLRDIDMLEDEREFSAEKIEREITSIDSNRKILEEIKRYSDEHEKKYGRFPKTLIFAVNDLAFTSHADQIVDLARDVFGRGDSFVQKITGKVDRPLQRIREFRNRNMPGIAVTVDLLSTGVDVPDLEYIVFLRSVKSRILFEQMMGRGTRKGEHYPDKSHFVVFDCFAGTLIDYFKSVTGVTAEPPQKQVKPISKVIEDIWNNRDRKYNTRILTKRLNRIDKEMSGEARDMFSAFVENGDLKSFAISLERRLEEDLTGTMAILRNKDFLNLLENYPRPKKTFLVDYGERDAVSSTWIVRDASGNEYKPDDYLEMFSEFVKENPEKISAISILLNRPQEWSTDALEELKKKLESSQQRFTVENLQRAHEVKYSKALVDIISMIKHAASEEEALLTAEERVSNAFSKVTMGKSFTTDQLLWLERIKAHLIANLSIDKEDFDYIPVFADHGGWNRANRVFEGELITLISEFNRAVAA